MKEFGLIGTAHLVQLICSLLGTVLVFRSLTPADVGTVITIVAFNGVLVIPMASGFAKIYSSLLVESDGIQEAERFYWIGCSVILCCALLPAGLAGFLHGDAIYAFFAGLMGAMGVHKMNLRRAENQGYFTRIALVRIGVGLALLGIKALAALRADPYLFAASFVLEPVLYFLALPARGSFSKVLRDRRKAISLVQLRSVLKLLPTEYAAGISLKYPLIMFGALSMPEAAALYNAAARLPDAFNGLIMALFAVIRPRAYREAAEKVPAQFPFNSTIGFVQTVLWLTLATMIVVPFIMPLLFGDFYRQAQLGVALYFLVSVTILMGIVQEVWMISAGLFRLSAIRVFLGATTSVTFTSLLYPILGLEGAILGVVFAGAVQAIFSNLFFPRLHSAFACQVLQLRSSLWPFGSRKE